METLVFLGPPMPPLSKRSLACFSVDSLYISANSSALSSLSACHNTAIDNETLKNSLSLLITSTSSTTQEGARKWSLQAVSMVIGITRFFDKVLKPLSRHFAKLRLPLKTSFGAHASRHGPTQGWDLCCFLLVPCGMCDFGPQVPPGALSQGPFASSKGPCHPYNDAKRL